MYEVWSETIVKETNFTTVCARDVQYSKDKYIGDSYSPSDSFRERQAPLSNLAGRDNQTTLNTTTHPDRAITEVHILDALLARAAKSRQE
jgi:hypothetical protein